MIRLAAAVRLLLPLGTACAFLITPRLVAAAVPLCVEVKAEPAEIEGLRKLVLSEIARFRSHRVVPDGCRSQITVEIFKAGTVRYLTARIGEEVPARYAVDKDAELPEKLTTALKQVLKTDPAYLAEDVTELVGSQRVAHSVLKRGHNLIRIELHEVVARTGSGAAFAPGFGAGLTRGADHWQVFSRIYFGGQPGSPAGDVPALKLHAGADGGLTYEVTRLSSISPYVSVGAGLQLMRFEGRVATAGGKGTYLDDVTKWGFTTLARAGIRALRLHDFDVDVYVAGYLPLFKTSDPDVDVVNAWTPQAVMGLGVGF